MWGVTGIFAAIPDPFRNAVDYLEPLQRIDNPAPGSGQRGAGGVAQSQDPAANTQNPAGPRGRRGGGRGRRPQFKPRVGDQILRGAYALHFGNFAGMKLKVVWAILGLMPTVLFVTGLLMWINRKVRRLRV
jgi:hypothetical protein